jgi:hypothetical protein
MVVAQGLRTDRGAGLLPGEAIFEGEAFLTKVGDKVFAVVDTCGYGSCGTGPEGAAERVFMDSGYDVGDVVGEGGDFGGGKVDGCAGVNVDAEANLVALQLGQGDVGSLFCGDLVVGFAVEAIVDLGLTFGEERDFAVGLCGRPDGARGIDLRQEFCVRR